MRVIRCPYCKTIYKVLINECPFCHGLPIKPQLQLLKYGGCPTCGKIEVGCLLCHGKAISKELNAAYLLVVDQIDRDLRWRRYSDLFFNLQQLRIDVGEDEYNGE